MRIIGRTLCFSVGRVVCGLSFHRPFFTALWSTRKAFNALVLFGKPNTYRRLGFLAFLSQPWHGGEVR